MKAFVKLLLQRCYYPTEPEFVGEGAQLVNGQWYMPAWGCDTLQHFIEGYGAARGESDGAK